MNDKRLNNKIPILFGIFVFVVAYLLINYIEHIVESDNSNFLFSVQVSSSSILKEFKLKTAGVYNWQVDSLRKQQLKHLGKNIIMDNRVHSLYEESYVEEVYGDLKSNLYGNTHSVNPSAAKSDEVITSVRDLTVSTIANWDLENNSVIFSPGRETALKNIGEAFPFSNKSLFIYVDTSSSPIRYVDDNNFITGYPGIDLIIQYAKRKNASVIQKTYANIEKLILQKSKIELPSSSSLNFICPKLPPSKSASPSPSLSVNHLIYLPTAAFDTGGLMPQARKAVEWAKENTRIESVECVEDSSSTSSSSSSSSATASSSHEKLIVVHNFFVFLDGDTPSSSPLSSLSLFYPLFSPLSSSSFSSSSSSSFTSSSSFSSSDQPPSAIPDFFLLSYAPLLGIPPGASASLSAVVARDASLSKLHKTYFAGGTITIALADEHFHQFRTKPNLRFEDGTLSFLSLVAVRRGLDALLSAAAVAENKEEGAGGKDGSGSAGAGRDGSGGSGGSGGKKKGGEGGKGEEESSSNMRWDYGGKLGGLLRHTDALFDWLAKSLVDPKGRLVHSSRSSTQQHQQKQLVRVYNIPGTGTGTDSTNTLEGLVLNARTHAHSICFVLVDEDGVVYDVHDVIAYARACGIYLGCVKVEGGKRSEMVGGAAASSPFSSSFLPVSTKDAVFIRITLSWMNVFSDVETLLNFLWTVFVNNKSRDFSVLVRRIEAKKKKKNV